MVAVFITLGLCILYWFGRLDAMYPFIPRWKISLALLVPVVLSYSLPFVVVFAVFVHEMYRFGLYANAHRDSVIAFFTEERYYYKNQRIELPADFPTENGVWAIVEYDDKIYAFSEQPTLTKKYYEDSRWAGKDKTKVGTRNSSCSRLDVELSMEKIK